MANEVLAQQQKKAGDGRMLLYAGLALGLLAAALIAVFLMDQSKKDGKPVPTTRLAVVAAQEIPERTRIRADMLKVSVFKIEDVDSEAFGSVGLLVDRVTSTKVASGQVILPTMVSDTRGTGLEFTVQPGMRAISISVKEVVTAGGNVTPGNFVDVIGLFEVPKEGDPNATAQMLMGEGFPRILVPAGIDTVVSVTLLQNVRVLAVAQNLPSEQANTSSNTGTAPVKETVNPRAATVTLEVTPAQAQILALADNRATIRLSLRPFAEDTKPSVTPFIIGAVD